MARERLHLMAIGPLSNALYYLCKHIVENKLNQPSQAALYTMAQYTLTCTRMRLLLIHGYYLSINGFD